jgi:hypothetical protein
LRLGRVEAQRHHHEGALLLPATLQPHRPLEALVLERCVPYLEGLTLHLETRQLGTGPQGLNQGTGAEQLRIDHRQLGQPLFQQRSQALKVAVGADHDLRLGVEQPHLQRRFDIEATVGNSGATPTAPPLLPPAAGREVCACHPG